MIIQRQQRQAARRQAFTLMEVLVVVAILVILAGAASIYVFGELDRAKDDRAKADVSTLARACEAYKLHFEDFPDSLEQLCAPPDGGKPQLDNREMLLDPWGRPYRYDKAGPNNNGLKPDVSTTGSKGQVIGNWAGAK
jgi:general secretion pathway protein G